MASKVLVRLATLEEIIQSNDVGRVVDRVHPRFLTHAQDNARWSTTDPPLAQLPSDLRHLLVPDPDWPWFGWDWDGQELRILAAIANDKPLLEAFANDWDVHSMNARDVFFGQTEASRYAAAYQVLGVRKDFQQLSVSQTNFLQQCVQELKAGVYSAFQKWLDGLPALKAEWETCLRAPAGREGWPGRGCSPSQWKQKRQSAGEFAGDISIRARTVAYATWVVCGGPPPDWLGKEDLRRTFAKRFVYRLNYGGDPRTAGDIPGAKTLGLTPARLVAASRAFLAAHPALAAWRRRTEAETLRTKCVRDFAGRRRMLHESGKAIVRAAFDYPMQAGGAEMLNITIHDVERWGAGKVLLVGNQMHDSVAFAVHRSIWTEETRVRLADFAEREWNINGTKVRIKGTFYTKDGKEKKEWQRSELKAA